MTVLSDRAEPGEPLGVERDDSHRHATLFRALHQLALAIAGTTDTPTLAKTILEHAVTLARADSGALYLWSAERDALVPVAVWVQERSMIFESDDRFAQTVPAGSGVTGQAFVQCRSIVVGAYEAWEGALPWVQAAGLRTLVSIPLVVAERAVGCLTLGSLAANACDDRLALELQLLASQVAPAFATARLLLAYQELNATLEQRVIDRTAQLEAAVKELEAFSYSVSHDLRAPLRSISSYSQILLRDHLAHLPPEAQDCLQRVGNASRRMGNLIDDLLQFSRLGRHPLSCQTVAMADLVADAIADLGAQTDGRVIEFEIAELPSCQGDATLLRQVFANLIENAVKYTSTRSIARIEVGAEAVNSETVYSVRDNGVGFDMRYADKLFGVFQRLHNSREYEGTGVGLAIVQRIVHRHGGRVWADAAVDQGATFCFTVGKREPIDG